MTEVIATVHKQNFGCYGVLKMWHALNRQGHRIGRDRVGRLMRQAGLAGAVRGRHRTVTTHRDREAPRHPDRVNRGWDITVPNTVWVADFTYVWTYAGFCYVSFITDVASRMILGWKASMSKEASLVTDALAQALFARRRGKVRFTSNGLIHHSDAGSQYTSIALTEHQVVGEQGFVRRGADEQFGHAVVLREVLDGAPFHRGPVPGLEGYGVQPVAGGAGAGVDGFEGDGPGAGQDRVLELGQGLRREVGAFAGDRRGAGQVDGAAVEGGQGGGQVGGDLVRVGQLRGRLFAGQGEDGGEFLAACRQIPSGAPASGPVAGRSTTIRCMARVRRDWVQASCLRTALRYSSADQSSRVSGSVPASSPASSAGSNSRQSSSHNSRQEESFTTGELFDGALPPGVAAFAAPSAAASSAGLTSVPEPVSVSEWSPVPGAAAASWEPATSSGMAAWPEGSSGSCASSNGSAAILQRYAAQARGRTGVRRMCTNARGHGPV